jgi:hypothetical protein
MTSKWMKLKMVDDEWMIVSGRERDVRKMEKVGGGESI